MPKDLVMGVCVSLCKPVNNWASVPKESCYGRVRFFVQARELLGFGAKIILLLLHAFRCVNV